SGEDGVRRRAADAHAMAADLAGDLGGENEHPALAAVDGYLGAVGASGWPVAAPIPLEPPVATATTPAGPGGRAACCWRASVVSSCVAGAHCRAWACWRELARVGVRPAGRAVRAPGHLGP